MRLTTLSLLLLAACGASTPATTTATGPATPADPAAGVPVAKVVPGPELVALVAATDRSAADRALDAGRKPAELLAFAALTPGMKVAELGAGDGYTSELLARALGPTGVVYGENSAEFLKFVEPAWSDRLKLPAAKTIVRADRPMDDPFPAEAKDLDAVFAVLVYHDTVWLKVDRAKLNRAVFAALKSGGEYVVVDHAAPAGAGTTRTADLHRIEEGVVIAEIEQAGFHLTEQADFLRNPEDPRDWSTSPKVAGARRGTSDRFVLKFTKP